MTNAELIATIRNEIERRITADEDKKEWDEFMKMHYDYLEDKK